MSLITDGIERIGIAATGEVKVSGNLTFSPDATYTIGLASSLRPSAVYTGILSVYSRIQTETNSLIIAGAGGSANTFSRIILGNNTASFPSIKRNGTAVNIRLADDSADAPLTCSNLTASGILSAGNRITGVYIDPLRIDTSTTISILSSDGIVVCNNSNPIVVTLPALSSIPSGKTFDIKNKGTGIATISGVDALIDGATSININQYDSMRVVTDSTDWLII
jgi:hypothetical protein